ncbi:MAG TPA: hypothetical protein VK907_06765 [Phnomibacter sp.]|nr:hypothetical protein [Phnomibacter sp.]
MKKLILIQALPALLLLGACHKDMNPKDQGRDIEARNGKPSGGGGGGTKLTAVPLNVSIDALNGISNDGKGAYGSGVDRVSATLRETDGQFFFQTNTQFKPRLRWLTFPYSPALNDKDDYRMVTDFEQPLQTMDPGTGSQTGGMRIWAYVNKSTEAFVMRYYYGVATGNPNSATSRVKVTRTDANTWVIEPLELELDGTVTVTAELKIGTGSFAPHNNVPFKITLTRK